MHGFLNFLSNLREGRAIDEMATALQEVQEGVNATGKAGTLTITISVAPASKGNRAMHTIKDKIAFKAPKPEADETVLFATNGGYSRRDPRQPELPVMRDINKSIPEEEAVNG